MRDISDKVDIVDCLPESEEIMPFEEAAIAITIGPKALRKQIGDPRRGIARIYSEACLHEFRLAYACESRCVCRSCWQKRVLPYGEWV